MYITANILTEEENIIYEHIREYLKKQPIFMLEEIIDYLSYQLRSNDNFNRNGIIRVIKSLIKKKMIFPGTKLVRDDILSIPKRVEIYDYITAMPGANLTEIINNLEIGSNHAIWHLKWLEKFEFVRINRLGNQKAYFKFEFESKYDEVFFYLRNTKVKKIIKLLKAHCASVKPTEISESLNIHYNTVRKYLSILKKFNLLMEIDENQKKEYLLNLDMFDVIQNVIENLK